MDKQTLINKIEQEAIEQSTEQEFFSVDDEVEEGVEENA